MNKYLDFSKTHLVYGFCILFFYSCGSEENVNLIDHDSSEDVVKKDSFNIIYESGYIKLSENDFNGAIKDFTAALEIDSTNPDAYYCRGFSLSAIGKDSLAVLDFNRSIMLKPDYKGAYFGRGLSLSLLNMNSEAISDYSTVLQIDPNFSNAWFNRGILLIQLGYGNEGLQDIRTAANLNNERAVSFMKSRGL